MKTPIMSKRDKVNRLNIVAILSITVMCLLPIFYRGIVDLDYSLCYKDLGKKYGVAANYLDVNEAVLKHVGEMIQPGMSREQVIAHLEQIAPVYTNNEGQLSNGGSSEFTGLKTCRFYENDIKIFIYYDKRMIMEKLIRDTPS